MTEKTEMTEKIENSDFVPTSDNLALSIKDKKGRDVIVVSKDGEIALARYPDLTEPEIKYILEIYSNLCLDDEEVKRKGRFLRYDDEDDEFCS